MRKKMKLAKLIDPLFQKTMQTLLKQPLPIKTAFKLRGIIRKIDEEVSKYEDVRKDALNKHGKKNTDGTLDLKAGVVQFEDGGANNFIKDISELTSMDIDLSTITIEELGEDLTLSTGDLIVLDGIIVD